MISLVVCITRKPGLSREEFSRHWREIHAPTLLACDDFARHIVSYVQYHAIDGDTSISRLFGVDGDHDGVAVITFADAEGLAAAYAEPRYMTDVRPDEFNFVDTEGCTTILASPFVVKSSADSSHRPPADSKL